MALNSVWNGEKPGHRNQYEILAESILDGQINLDYNDMDPKLLELDNPYDPSLREGVSYHWDHAFYNGKYYMYFGVVPVFLLFLPFRIITGTSLITYLAIQIFTSLFIFGIFSLFLLIGRKFFKNLSLSVYLSLSVAVSLMSVWYLVGTPSLYCTAIAAGIALEIWSLFFLAQAVWNTNNREKTIYRVNLGSLLGALTFGCRPTIGLANLIAIPFFLEYLKKKPLEGKLGKKILAIFIPYIIIASLLMIYNYVRFENPFEFGQSYQLTVADQTPYGNLLTRFNGIALINGMAKNFIKFVPLKNAFPYISYQSILLNFPIVFIAIMCSIQKDTLLILKRDKLIILSIVLWISYLLITIFQVLNTPYLLERYRSDIYWIIGIFLFISFGSFLKTLNGRSKKIWEFLISILALVTIFQSFLLWLIPSDSSFTAVFPETLHTFEEILRLGF